MPEFDTNALMISDNPRAWDDLVRTLKEELKWDIVGLHNEEELKLLAYAIPHPHIVLLFTPEHADDEGWMDFRALAFKMAFSTRAIPIILIASNKSSDYGQFRFMGSQLPSLHLFSKEDVIESMNVFLARIQALVHIRKSVSQTI